MHHTHTHTHTHAASNQAGSGLIFKHKHPFLSNPPNLLFISLSLGPAHSFGPAISKPKPLSILFPLFSFSPSPSSFLPPMRRRTRRRDSNSDIAFAARDGGAIVNSKFEASPAQNSAFEDYYKEQGIVDDEEWDTFVEFLRKPLPSAFRINSSGQFCMDIHWQIEKDFAKSLHSECIEDDEVEALRPLPWYPENLAWHSNFSRKQLRKNRTLERFHEFLKLAHELGNITRQEAVSMVPPLFLDVRPNHFVLDMCAAPGSKTFQLLEIIHRSNQPGSLPSGMVVANDVNVLRSNLLIHQTKKMCTANLIVTNNEGQHFPGCLLSESHNNATDVEFTNGLNIKQLLFDRILCDVPCSGDGTLRKASDIWRRWNAGMANGLHGLQLKIAMRGISLLEVGGRMVYSTCSMNPVENEAVVAEILRRCGNCVELLDVSNDLEQLVRRPGLKKWKVRDKGLWLSSYKDVPERRRPGILSSMFPSGRTIDSLENNGSTHNNDGNMEYLPQTSDDNTQSPAEINDDEVCNLPLERCMRILPHDQNTGAFFIAVFHKRSPFPVYQEKSNGVSGFLVHKNDRLTEEVSTADVNRRMNGLDSATLVGTEMDIVSLDNDCIQTLEDDGMKHIANDDKEPDSQKVGTKRKLPIQRKWKGLDPVIFLKDESVISSIISFYGINESFPLYGHLVTRNGENDLVKRIYYISKSVKDVLELNILTGEQLKIASVGLKVFERQTSKDGNSSPCRYRITSEALPLLLPNITKQILFASFADFSHLLQYKSIKFGDFVDANLGERASKLELGGCVVVLREAGQELSIPPQVDSSTIAIGCWRGRSNINVMVSALDCCDLLERLMMRQRTKARDAVMEGT